MGGRGDASVEDGGWWVRTEGREGNEKGGGRRKVDASPDQDRIESRKGERCVLVQVPDQEI